MVALHGSSLLGVSAKVGDTVIAHGHCTAQAQNHPSHADTARAHQRFHAFGGHETCQNVRLAEVAQAPGGSGNDADESCAVEQAAVFLTAGSGGGLDDGGNFICAARAQIHHHRREQQGENHQRGLHSVCPAYRQEAADKGVGNGGARAQPHGAGVAHAGEQALEQACAGHNAAGAVNGEEKQNDERGNHLHRLPVRTEAVVEIIGQGKRVVVVFGVYAQPPGHQEPVEVRADNQADGNPRFAQAAQIHCARQAHQQPAGHIRSPGRHGGNKRAQATAAEDIVVKIAGGEIGREAD